MVDGAPEQFRLNFIARLHTCAHARFHAYALARRIIVDVATKNKSCYGLWSIVSDTIKAVHATGFNP